MAKSRTGTSTIIKLVRKICKLYGTWGAYDLEARTSTGYKAAVVALVAACALFEAADDYPGEIDYTAPLGPEDTTP